MLNYNLYTDTTSILDNRNQNIYIYIYIYIENSMKFVLDSEKTQIIYPS